MKNQEMDKTQEELPETPPPENGNDRTGESFLEEVKRCGAYRPVFKSLDSDIHITVAIWLAGTLVFAILGFHSSWWFGGWLVTHLPFMYVVYRARRALEANQERNAAFLDKTKPKDIKIWFGSYRADKKVFCILSCAMLGPAGGLGLYCLVVKSGLVAIAPLPAPLPWLLIAALGLSAAAGLFFLVMGVRADIARDRENMEAAFLEKNKPKDIKIWFGSYRADNIVFSILCCFMGWLGFALKESPWFWLPVAAAVLFFVMSVRASIYAAAKPRPLKTCLGYGCGVVLAVIVILFTCFDSLIEDTIVQAGLKFNLSKAIGEVKKMTKLAPSTYRVEFKGDEEVRCVIWDHEKGTGTAGVLLSPDSPKSLIQLFRDKKFAGEIFVFEVPEGEIASVQEKRIPAGCRWVAKPRELCCFEDGKKYTFFVVRNSETGAMFLSGADDASAARLNKEK